jgi:hypothetical protein
MYRNAWQQIGSASGGHEVGPEEGREVPEHSA